MRRRIPNLKRIVMGFIYVLLGLTLFLVGLEEALFPIGETMATQLTAAAVVDPAAVSVQWDDYLLVYAFAFAIGFATTIAEPSLIAVALKAEEVSGGAVGAQGLRIAVALGVAVGVALGCFRIVTGTPLPWYIVAAYAVVIVQTFRSSRTIVPLAYDSGGVTTSTVTVPVLAALGLGLAASVPGRSPLIDGFGLIAFASVFPIMSVLGYAMVVSFDLAPARRQHGPQKEIPAMRMKLIVVLAADDKTDTIIDAAREGGATGATVITSVRGEGLKPEKTFLGLEITAKRDVLLFLVVEERAQEILERIRDVGRFDQEPGAGVAFQIAIDDVVGLTTQLPIMMKEVEDDL